ncbi:unnamed protein product [Rhizoctonia solani]|uniref:Uncharacterized protein n=1 Tax=Rhizoctonia solani TaxID=456999 RepID=A0A8H3CWC4_9AGAM|nr:unnamed protein product [Rhizoctonia solani]
MNNLRKLTLDECAPIVPYLLEGVSFRLTHLDLLIPSQASYPVSQFLSSQPTIEELLIICQSNDLSALSPDALPSLRNLSAPLTLLPTLLAFRLPHIARLSILGVMTHSDELIILSLLLALFNPPESLMLVVKVRVGANAITIADISRGLSILGEGAPFITLLALAKYGDQIGQDELQDMFIYALPHFPNLKQLNLMSRPMPQGADTRNPQVEPVRTPSGILSLLYNALAYLYSMLVNTPILFYFFSSRHAQQIGDDQTQNQPNPNLDPFYDRSCHQQIIMAWRQVHPKLEFVVFPGGKYKVKSRGSS